MVQELDTSFDALVLVGYHSKAGTEGNPLAHTLTLQIADLRLSGELCSEFRLHTFAAALYGVPLRRQGDLRRGFGADPIDLHGAGQRGSGRFDHQHSTRRRPEHV